MLACVEIFKKRVLQLTPRYFVPYSPLQQIDISGPMILCTDALHDEGASVWARDDDAEGHFNKRLFGPLHPSSLQSSHSGG